MSIKRGNTIIAGVPIIEGTLNTVSTLPVQNKVITKAINDLNDRVDQLAPGGVYTKQETDDLLADKADAATTYTKTDIDNMFATLYPIGSLYIGTQSLCPLLTLISGSVWVLVGQDRSLQGSSNTHAANTTIEAGLPNITGNLGPAVYDFTLNNTSNQAFYNAGDGPSRYAPWEGQNSTKGTNYHGFDANRCSSIYGNSTTVQPPAYVVNVWRRTA